MSIVQQVLSVFAVKVPALGLNVRTDRTANVWTFIMVESALCKGAVYYFYSSVYQAGLICVLYSKDESASVFSGMISPPGGASKLEIPFPLWLYYSIHFNLCLDIFYTNLRLDICAIIRLDIYA